MKTPAVRLGKPAERSRAAYRQIAVDSIVIWQPADIEADQPDGLIEITLTKFLLFKNLSIQGARAKLP